MQTLQEIRQQLSDMIDHYQSAHEYLKGNPNDEQKRSFFADLLPNLDCKQTTNINLMLQLETKIKRFNKFKICLDLNQNETIAQALLELKYEKSYAQALAVQHHNQQIVYDIEHALHDYEFIAHIFEQLNQHQPEGYAILDACYHPTHDKNAKQKGNIAIGNIGHRIDLNVLITKLVEHTLHTSKAEILQIRKDNAPTTSTNAKSQSNHYNHNQQQAIDDINQNSIKVLTAIKERFDDLESMFPFKDPNLLIPQLVKIFFVSYEELKAIYTQMEKVAQQIDLQAHKEEKKQQWQTQGQKLITAQRAYQRQYQNTKDSIIELQCQFNKSNITFDPEKKFSDLQQQAEQALDQLDKTKENFGRFRDFAEEKITELQITTVNDNIEHVKNAIQSLKKLYKSQCSSLKQRQSEEQQIRLAQKEVQNKEAKELAEIEKKEFFQQRQAQLCYWKATQDAHTALNIKPINQSKIDSNHENAPTQNKEHVADFLSKFSTKVLDLLGKISSQQYGLKYEEIKNLIVNQLGGKVEEIGNGSSHKRIVLDDISAIMVSHNTGERPIDETSQKQNRQQRRQAQRAAKKQNQPTVKGTMVKSHGKRHNSGILSHFNLKRVAEIFAKAGYTQECIEQACYNQIKPEERIRKLSLK